MSPWPLLMRTVSQGGNKGRLSVFIFHRVLREPDPLLNWDPDAARFRQLMVWVTECFNILPLDEAVRRLSERSLPPRAASITFDDGYADNFHIARPILESLGLTATFFIATGYLDGGIMWNDKVIEAIRHCRNESSRSLFNWIRCPRSLNCRFSSTQHFRGFEQYQVPQVLAT